MNRFQKFCKSAENVILLVSLLALFQTFIVSLFLIVSSEVMNKHVEEVYISTKLGSNVYHYSANCIDLKNSYEIATILPSRIKECNLRTCYTCVLGEVLGINILNVNKKFYNISFVSILVAVYALFKLSVRKQRRITLLRRQLSIYENNDSMLKSYLRDILPSSPKHEERENELLTFTSEIHNTDAILNFLNKFRDKEYFKYTTHIWDSEIKYNEFIAKVRKILCEEETVVKDRIPHLWSIVSSFLNDEEQFGSWKKGNSVLKVGYNKYLREWLIANPGEQPFAMPLSVLPEELIPLPVDKKSLNTFSDVVNLFKHMIEFRDKDLYLFIKGLFKKYEFIYDEDKLKRLIGVCFYTDTESVKKAMEIAIDNMANHSTYKEIDLKCESKDNKIIIEFTSLNSYSDAKIDSDKILAKDQKKDMYRIKEILTNICDFGIKSRFVNDNGKKSCYNICYLSSDDNYNGIMPMSDIDCGGFSYYFIFRKS